jgi:parallel beta-helix repeat protein
MWYAAATYARRLLVFAAGSFVALSLLLVSAASGEDASVAPSGQPDITSHRSRIVLTPIADATVAKSHPTTKYGFSRNLRVTKHAGRELRSYVKFRVGRSVVDIVSATLTAYVAGRNTENGPAVGRTTNTWREGRVTWRNHPRRVGPTLDDVGRVRAGHWVRWDVTEAVRRSGTYSFALVGESERTLDLLSRKTGKPPKLVVEGTVDTKAPSPPADLHQDGATESSIGAAWSPSTDDVGVVGYRVYVDGGLAGSTASTAYALTALDCARSYTVGVEAYDLAHNTSQRSTFTAATAECTPSSTPSTSTESTPPTTTEPPPPTTTPPTTTSGTTVQCTKTLVAGGDLSSFLASLVPGDTGCLRGGTYTDGTSVTWTTDGSSGHPIVLTEFPGETAEVAGTEIVLAGDYLTVHDLTVRDVVATDADGISVSGKGDTIEHNRLSRTARHGILLHSSATNATVARNFVSAAGVDGGAHSTLSPSQIHGIYVQGSGHRVVRNIFAGMTGYGIHVYGSPSNVVVSGNTAVGSTTRTGLLVRTTGSGIVIVNNLFEGGSLHTCGGCLIDTNQVAGGWNVQDPGAPQATNTVTTALEFADASYHLPAGSVGIDAGRSDYAVSPDLDGAGLSGSPDLGAYES